jgi:hypothetical protein
VARRTGEADGGEPTDAELLDMIGSLDTEVPDWVTAAADIAWAWRAPDESLAELLDDTAIGAATTRASTAMTRSVAYGIGDLTIELAVSYAGALAAVDVLLVPSRPAEGVLLVARGATVKELPLPIDDTGSARVEIDPAAHISLRLIIDGERHITPWLPL